MNNTEYKKDYIYYKDLKDKLVNSHMIDLL